MFEKVMNMQVRRSVIVLIACGALIIGLALAQRFALSDARWLWLLSPMLVLTLPHRKIAATIVVIILCLGVGLWRGTYFSRKLAIYNNLADTKVIITGVADDDAVYGKNSQLSFTLAHARVTSPYPAQLTGSLSIAGFGASAIYRGDHISVAGKLYQTRGNNLAGISYGTLHVMSRHISPLDTVRRKFAAGLQSTLPEPLASFGMGLLVGQRNTLPADISQMLLAVGLTHIIAVSGYNLTIILRAAGRLLANRSKFQYMCCSVGLMALFLGIAGSSPSIVRASVVSGLGLTAWYYGRTVKPLVLLLVSAAMTGLANPVYIWGNISWYLSFLAFFGVLVLAPLVTKRLFGAREPSLVLAVVIESLCAEMMTLPYILHIFGQMSFVAIPSNVLVVALVPLAMVLSLIAGLAGMVIPALAGWFAWPAKLLMTYMMDVVNLLSRIPHSFVQNIGFSLMAMLTSYAIVLFIWWVLAHNQAQKIKKVPPYPRQSEVKLV